MNKPLSVLDIFEIAGKSCNVVPYNQIHKINDIDDLFDQSPLFTPITKYPYDPNSCLILYLTSNNYGHWCILNRHNGNYQFLDSYGEIFDNQLKHIDKKYRVKSKQNERYLTELLNNKSQLPRYNDHQLQRLSDNISTCGRYAALFLKHNDMKVEDFVKTLEKQAKKYNLDPDQLVTRLTYI